MTITKSYKSHNFGANKICDISVDLGVLGVRQYSGHNYYMWDARENYWSGHEWDSADPWQPKGSGYNGNFPMSYADPASRWCNEGDAPLEASVNPLFKKLPNANEMAWYVVKGGVHWDNTTQWKAFGTTYTGGIWLKRLSVIAQENHKQLAALKKADPNGKNLLTSYGNYELAPTPGKPKNSEINNYFFLPALGYYHFGRFNEFGSNGVYWSSSAFPGGSSSAYYLCFSSSRVYVNSDNRYNGFVAQPFE